MKKKIMAVLAAVISIFGALSAQDAPEDMKIKRVIPDASAALANFEFERFWSFWCADGFVEKNGVKTSVADIKKTDLYKKMLELHAMQKAKTLEELVDLQVRAGELTPQQKDAILALPDARKKITFRSMQQKVRLKCRMFQMGLRTLGNVPYKSLRVDGDTARAVAFFNNAMLGSGELAITYKKINGSWKIYSAVTLPPETEKK